MIKPVNLVSFANAKNNSSAHKDTKSFTSNKQILDLSNLPTQNMLAQFAKVSFKGAVESDEVSDFNHMTGKEQLKYRMSCEAKVYIDNGNYYQAGLKKLSLIEMCNEDGLNEDAFLLGESVHKCCEALADEKKFWEAAQLKSRHSKICKKHGEEQAAIELAVAASDYLARS